MKIDVVNGFTVPKGKRADAVKLLKKFVALHTRLLPEMSARVVTPTTGAFNRAFMVFTFESHEDGFRVAISADGDHVAVTHGKR